MISCQEKFLTGTGKNKTPAGNFTNCLKTEETSALNLKEKEFKRYATGIGLIQDENLYLVKYRYVK